jgi:pimeloyl-ACP methyl ester carboxylesterase
MRVFRTSESKREYDEAYAAALEVWPVPYEELSIPTQYGETHVIASGDIHADPLVLLQPAGCGATIWYRNVGVLSRYFRTYAVDTVGEVNKSLPTRRIDSRKGCADWIVDLFDGLRIKQADIIGNSFGGFLTLNAALQVPERVRKIVLISPAASFVQMWPWIWHFFPAYVSRSRKILEWAYDWIWQGFPIDSCIVRMRTIASVSGIPLHIGPSVFSDMELQQIKAPTLLLIGDREVIYDSDRVFARAKKLLPCLKAEMVRDANHNAEYTAAKEVNQKVVAFLRGAENEAVSHPPNIAKETQGSQMQ